MIKGDDIQERLIQFAARIIKLGDALPRTRAGRHIAGQLLRSGTAAAAHHTEARSAESQNDFIHKLKIAIKELNETEVWLRIVVAAEMKTDILIASLLDECQQLQRIFGASIQTARKNR
jgi:four helix bundle protein